MSEKLLTPPIGFEGKMCYNSTNEITNGREVRLTLLPVLTNGKGYLHMATSDYTPDSIEVPLTKGKVCYIDSIDADLVTVKWSLNFYGYATRTFRPYIKRIGTLKYLHRLIMERVLGRELTNNEIVDHADGDRLNNRRSNLRLATKSQNSMNAKLRTDNTTGFKGVCWYKAYQKYMASIMVDGKSRHLGYFDTAEAAYHAYCEAAKEFFGDYARLK